MHKITIGKLKKDLPSNWHELNKEQLLILCKLSLVSIPINELKAKLIMLWLNIKIESCNAKISKGVEVFRFRHKAYIFWLSADDIAALSNLLDWLFVERINKKDGTKSFLIYSKLIRNLLPELKVDDTIYYGPADALTNIKYKEYIHLETAYDNYAKTQSDYHLSQMIAILYREKDPDYDMLKPSGDIRKPLNDFMIEKSAEIFMKLNPEERLAFFHFYAGCKAFLAKKFPNVFGGSNTGKKTDDVFMEYLKLTSAMAQDDVTKFEAIRDSYLYEVMTALDEIIRKATEINDKINKK